mgnify:CR=1 FL=1
MKNAIVKIFTAILFIYAPRLSQAGHFTGNGGDHVRGMFLKLGEAVVSYLNETEEGKKLLADHNLSSLGFNLMIAEPTLGIGLKLPRDM